ncbi:hypothetical protein AWRI1631_50430 [Saccharomyces cerevisiae AWRI1631]|uniref:Uncharacterized protein n=1 Tax=Saccharomyces cerevisiae (strain AWRI1631) TaxID=545124 RepID=B5VHA8_YEAS6|nr:hypothetical protein AWRI1631_50430 [Saccharomyces cerevisiae AWRI1631]
MKLSWLKQHKPPKIVSTDNNCGTHAVTFIINRKIPEMS